MRVSDFAKAQELLTASYSRKLWMASDSGGFFGNFDSIDKLYPLKNLREKKSTV